MRNANRDTTPELQVHNNLRRIRSDARLSWQDRIYVAGLNWVIYGPIRVTIRRVLTTIPSLTVVLCHVS